MCGRYSLTTAPEALRQLFNFLNTPNFGPRYNIAPTQDVWAVRQAPEGRVLVALRWGLVPGWAKDLSGGAKMINARAETVAERPAYRDAFRHRRCLIPADGFYEWRTEDGRKQPFRIGMRGGGAFAFAGLWESWTDKSDAQARPVESCTILTTDANDKLRPIHPRMPVILKPEAYEPWLTTLPEDAGKLLGLVGPYPAEPMAFYRVSTRVNAVRNDDEAVIAPLSQQAG